MLKSTIFREYDIRGIAETELASPDVADLGRALGTYMQRNSGKRVNVGRDCRLSSPRLRDALVEGLKSTGCEVTDIGTVPTPLTYFSAVHLESDGAVMITGSHNPGDFNGFKSVCGPTSLHGEAIQEIRKMIESKDFLKGHGTHQFMDVIPSYLHDVLERIELKRKIRIVVDAGNGTAGPVATQLLDRLNCDYTPMFFDMDGTFPNHHPDPTVPENLKMLADEVRKQGADFGVGFDGDSDRIGAVDENGEVVYGDMLMLIFGREILTRKPGATFIGEVKCSQVLYDELKKLGGNPIMYKTGHSLIKAKMKAEKAELAGEMSGHMFFKDRYYGYDDALYAMCRLMEIVAASGKPLSAQLAGLPKMVSTPEIRVDCPDEIKFQVVANVVSRFKQTHPVNDIDGARVQFADGWGLIRASNTQPVLVMRFEAANADSLAANQREVERVLGEAKQEVG